MDLLVYTTKSKHTFSGRKTVCMRNVSDCPLFIDKMFLGEKFMNIAVPELKLVLLVQTFPGKLSFIIEYKYSYLIP